MNESEKPKHSLAEEDKSKRPPQPRLLSTAYFLVVILAATGYGILMFFVFRNLLRTGQNNDIATVAFLGFVPVGIGAISTFSIAPERRTVWNVIGVAMLTTIMFVIITGYIASGMVLCLLMILPFLLVFAAIGALIVFVIYRVSRGREREKRKRQYVFAGFLLILPVLLTPIEERVPPPNWTRDVADSIVIEGTPETVWNNIIRMDTISSDEQRPSFYHTMGIPRPVRATLDKEAVGGIRQGEFEFGLMFYETITVWQPNERVHFTVDVHKNPQSSPVLMQIGGPSFDITEAGYQIEVIDESHVRLKLDSSYRLSTNFNFYGAFWADWIMHDFQSYVLQTVKQRSEARGT